ncbi:MAG TPA: ABC transporter permease [Acidimicrobiales bacterium]
MTLSAEPGAPVGGGLPADPGLPAGPALPAGAGVPGAGDLAPDPVGAAGAAGPGVGPGAGPAGAAGPASRNRGSRIRRLGGPLLSAAVSVAVGLGAWQLFLEVFAVDPFIGKGPADVWRHLTSDAEAASRSELWEASVTTLRDAFIGLAAGTVVAVLVAIAFTLWRSVERTFMPIAMVLRSVPLVAMTPLIALVFGRGLMGVTVIAGIVTFFPTLVNVTLALRSTPREAIDLCRAYGASATATLRKVQIPVALPALFASLRIAAPLALIGALLAEWLATGDGLGYLMQRDMTMFQVDQLWSAVFLVTLYSIALYTAIGAVERVVLRRFGPPAAAPA